MGEQRVAVGISACEPTREWPSEKPLIRSSTTFPPGGEGTVGCRFVGNADLPFARPPSPARDAPPNTHDTVAGEGRGWGDNICAWSGSTGQLTLTVRLTLPVPPLPPPLTVRLPLPLPLVLPPLPLLLPLLLLLLLPPLPLLLLLLPLLPPLTLPLPPARFSTHPSWAASIACSRAVRRSRSVAGFFKIRTCSLSGR